MFSAALRGQFPWNQPHESSVPSSKRRGRIVLARWRILMKRVRIGSPILGLMVCVVCSLAALPAYADDWSKTYTLTGKPDLRVETSDADIHVATWDQNTIEAKVTTTHYKIGEDGIRIEEHQNGDTVEINVRYPHHGLTIGLGNYSNHRVDISIHMPREGRV